MQKTRKQALRVATKQLPSSEALSSSSFRNSREPVRSVVAERERSFLSCSVAFAASSSSGRPAHASLDRSPSTNSARTQHPSLAPSTKLRIMPGTSPDLTIPPISADAPAQASSKSALPTVPAAAEAAKAIASRRESTSIAAGKTDAVEDEKKLKEFVEDDRHFSLVRNFRLADCVTLGNGFCGALSLFSSARYLLTSDQAYLWHALAYPLAGMFFDALDGKVARWRNESSMLGQELDSLADSISFGVAPALAAFCLGLRTTADTILLTTFICTGIARLARFNATVALVPKDASGKSKYFEGLPIPSSLLLCGVMAECVRRGLIEGGKGVVGGLILPLKNVTGIELHYASLVFAGWGALMISKTLRIPKF